MCGAWRWACNSHCERTTLQDNFLSLRVLRSLCVLFSSPFLTVIEVEEWNTKQAKDAKEKGSDNPNSTSDGRLTVVRGVMPRRVTAAFPEQLATMLTAEVPDQVLTLQTTTPAGTSRTSLLAPRCR